MDEKHIFEAAFYGGSFAIGCAAAVCRMVHERSHRDGRDLVAISVQGGLWSFGVIGILGHFYPSVVTSYWFGLGVASFVGLGGKEQDKYLRLFLNGLFAYICSKFGFTNLTAESDEPKKD